MKVFWNPSYLEDCFGLLQEDDAQAEKAYFRTTLIWTKATQSPFLLCSFSLAKERAEIAKHTLKKL